MKNGKIVRGLSGVPDKGPVLFVGYHQLLAIELSSLVEGFLREKKTIIRTAAHPVFFAGNYEMLRQELSLFDSFSMYGAAPVSPINMYKLLERNEFVLMYPGGVREALHRKVCAWTEYSGVQLYTHSRLQAPCCAYSAALGRVRHTNCFGQINQNL
jgi:hypothetical protein